MLPLPQETAGWAEVAVGAATTVSAVPVGAPAAVSRRSDTPFWLDSKRGKPSTLVQTTTGPPAVSTQTSGRSPLTSPVLILTWVPTGAPVALSLRARICGVVPGKLPPAGSRLAQTTM